VSAVSASPAAQGPAGDVPADPVRALQHALYRAAKADPGRRFHALMDKVIRSDVLWRAWVMVRRNNGAPGIDKITLAQVEEHGVARLLGELASELREKRYRPLPARRVLIPKPGSDEMRPLSITAVRDQIVQAALKIVLESVFEADFLPCSFGVPPEALGARRPPGAHRRVLAGPPVRERICDQPVLKLVRARLRRGDGRRPGPPGHGGNRSRIVMRSCA
jgi:RNA-directed DNA polymerase